MFDEVNQLAANGMSDFRVESYNGSQLAIIGSFDLGYYHDIEITFNEVAFIHIPTLFFGPHFRDAGATDRGRRFVIKTDDGEFEIVAETVEVVIGKVYHYDRGTQLQPGERIAPWVRRNDA